MKGYNIYIYELEMERKGVNQQLK